MTLQAKKYMGESTEAINYYKDRAAEDAERQLNLQLEQERLMEEFHVTNRIELLQVLSELLISQTTEGQNGTS